MDKNICRVFTFYSNFLPAITEEHRWEYCAFGTIDGIDVGENIAENGGEILDCIWKEHTQFQKILSGTYNAERIYGIRFGDTETEKEFWEEDPEYPFLFFTRIQCEGDKVSLWNKNNRCKLEEKFSLGRKMKIMTYLTYGNSDLFLVIKARSYQKGAQLIHSMNQGMNLIFDSKSVCYLKNSFSIMAVKHDWIDGMEYSQRVKLNAKKIECVCIKIIKEPNEDVAKLVQAINNRIKGIDVQRKAVLGVDDEHIILKNIGWGDFLSLYSRTEGVFCNSNKKFRTVWAGSTTTIQEELPDIMNEFRDSGIYFGGDSNINENKFKEISENSKALGVQYISQKNALMEILRQIQKESSDKDFKEINIILNSVPRYAGGLFNDYVFYSILSPINFLLCLMQENLKMGTLNMRDYYDFLKAFCMYVQGSLTSDRHSIQAIDFNSKIYEVPAKIIAFYSAHINFVKRILSTFDDEKDSCAYEFLVAPGISNVVYVDELYCSVSNQKRLMKVEIPEYCLYNLHDMMIILTHETAHYVGRRYRLRDETRYDSILKSFSHIYVSYVRSWCLEEKVCQQVKDSAWKTVEQRMQTILHRALERKLDKDYVSSVENDNRDRDYTHVVEKNKTYGKHMTQLQANIQMAMIDIVQFSLKNIFGPVLYAQENSEGLFFCIKQASERYIVIHESGSTLMSSKTTMDVLSMIYEEGFADLMAILVLNLNAIEYVDGLLNEVERQSWKLEDCYRSDILYRIGIVLQCCFRDEKMRKDFIPNFYEGGVNKKKQTDAEKLIERALMTFEKNRRKPVEPEKYHKELKNILRDADVVNEVWRYLILCSDIFYKDYEKPSDDMKKIRTFFKKYSNTQGEFGMQDVSAEEQIAELLKIIWESRDNILCVGKKETGEYHEC